MSINCRFALDERRNVIDAVNVANSGKAYCHEGDPEDDKHLRERILMIHLGKLIDKLIINLRPMQKLPSGEEYKPHNEERFAIWWAMLDTIRASHLNTFDPCIVRPAQVRREAQAPEKTHPRFHLSGAFPR